MHKRSKVGAGMRAASEWTAEKLWAVGYLIKLTLAVPLITAVRQMFRDAPRSSGRRLRDRVGGQSDRMNLTFGRIDF